MDGLISISISTYPNRFILNAFLHTLLRASYRAQYLCTNSHSSDTSYRHKAKLIKVCLGEIICDGNHSNKWISDGSAKT